MQIYVFQSPAQAARAAAMVFASELARRPDAAFGLATGSTPLPLYQELIRLHREGLIDFARCRTWNLDEYVGLPAGHACSYRRFMDEQLFDHINIRKENTHVPSGIAADLAAEARAYDAAIEAAGGIDVQLLGIGQNGHIGFNEPADTFTCETHVVNLTPSTIDANTRFFASRDEVPRQAISMGVGGIMKARRVVLLAAGAGKAEAIRDSASGPITPRNQASILRVHADCQYFLDEAAAQLLPR